MNVPEDLRYSSDHEWARLEDGEVRVGITDYAQDALGDVVFVQVPEVGTAVEAGATFGEVESTKSVSDIYAPVAGTVVEVNAELADAPKRLNEDPYGEGWICVIEPDDAGQLDELLDAGGYRRWSKADVARRPGGRRLLQQLRAPEPARRQLLLVVRHAARARPEDPTTITFQIDGGGRGPPNDDVTFDLDDIPPDGGLLVVVRGPNAGRPPRARPTT